MLKAKEILYIDDFTEFLKNHKKISSIKEKITTGSVYIIKSAIDKKYIEKVKKYLISIGKNSLPNYEPIELNAKNSHRINILDERAYVKGCFHQFSFYPWNQDILQLFNYTRDVYFLRNLINGLPKERYVENILENDGCVARLSFQFYPKSIGALNRHTDPVGEHQLCVPLLIMSKKGDDFNTGGLFVESKGKKIYVDDLCDIGDVVLFNAQIPHGVDVIDKEKEEDWFSFEGRMMMIFAINKVGDNNSVINSSDLD